MKQDHLQNQEQLAVDQAEGFRDLTVDEVTVVSGGPQVTNDGASPP